MNRRLAFIAGLCALSSARLAVAQSGELTIGYQGLPHKPSTETTTGIQVSDDLMMHLGLGVEAGYDTNVFYQNSDTTGSSIIRGTAYASIGNANRSGQSTGSLGFGAGAGLTYRRYLSPDPKLDGYRNALMPTGNLSLGTGSGQFSFLLLDSFIRLEDAPYAPGQLPLTRDDNNASVEGRWSPGGGRITASLRYSNVIDVFEDADYSYANSVSNLLLLDLAWKWLPKTAIFFDASQGYVTYLNTQTRDAQQGGKVASYPLHLIAGLRGLITPKVSAVLSLGYVNAFYSSGATTSGLLGSTYLLAQATITPSLLNRIVVGFQHDFQNSVISNFYYEDAFFASFVQQLGGRFAIDLSGRLGIRRYEGFVVDNTIAMPGVPVGQPVTTPRTDEALTAGATLDYFVRNWAYAGVGYSVTANFSDYSIVDMNGVSTPASYLKQQVFARLGVTY